MKHGKREIPRKRKPLLMRVLLTVAVAGLAVVGVAAYLSHSSNSVKNDFSVENHPVVTVSDSGITVTDPGYAVYLRAAVVVNWVNKENGNILAVQPVAGTDYTLTVNEDWKQGDDGFYYYTEAITSGVEKLSPVAVTQIKANGDYTLKVSIAAQTVQAVGTTDGDSPVDAVQDAWGEAAANLLKGTS